VAVVWNEGEVSRLWVIVWVFLNKFNLIFFTINVSSVLPSAVCDRFLWIGVCI
jgi:hypothetical protein